MKNNSCLLVLILFVLSSCVSNSNEAMMYSHVDKNNSVRLVSTHSGEDRFNDESLFGEYLDTAEWEADWSNEVINLDNYWQGIAFETKYGRRYFLYGLPKQDFSKRDFIIELISRCEIVNEYECAVNQIEREEYYGGIGIIEYRRINGITTWQDRMDGILTIADAALVGFAQASSVNSTPYSNNNISAEVKSLRSEIDALKRQKILEQNTLKIEPSIYKPKEKN